MRYLIIFIISIFAAVGCIEDDFSTSPSDQPVFSVDTLDLGIVFTDEPTPTHRFLVHNPHSKALAISNIRISGTDASCFRINVDGISGETFENVEIRPNDSIFVFVEATLPETEGDTTHIEADINFNTNGVTNSVLLTATGVNVIRHRGTTITADTRFTAEKPYIVFDSLVVAPEATLTIEPGANIYFHDKAMLVVRGTLLAEGTTNAPITMCGDRTGNVVTDISFDIMSRQWVGVFFTSTSHSNRLVNTTIKNTTQALAIAGDTSADYSSTPQLYMLNSRLRNSGDLVLEAYHSAIEAYGCEFAEAANGLVFLQGGSHHFVNCTFANNYLFAAIGGAAIQMAHLSADEATGIDDGSGLPFLNAYFDNCIVYGIGNDLSHGDLTGTDVFFRRTLLKSNGSDDDNFIECIWGEDPLYYTIREEYIFDYRLMPESPAIGAGNPDFIPAAAATDGYGKVRGSAPDLGAYVFVQPEESEQ